MDVGVVVVIAVLSELQCGAEGAVGLGGPGVR